MNDCLTYYSLKEIKHKLIHGRTDETQSPLPLFWSGSAIEINPTGTELWIDVETDYDMFEPWAASYVNENFMSRQMLPKGRHKICLLRGMSAGVKKNVRFSKETQAMSEDPACRLLIHGFYTDGDFAPIEFRPYKIEFIGDSITSGEGTYGAVHEEDWLPMFMSAERDYAVLTADALYAEYRLLSQSGWGVYTGWENNPNNNLPAYYEQICGLAKGEVNEMLGAHKRHDFSLWQPDIVVVNLGTNDAGAFTQPAWTNLETGEIVKQRMNPDGSYVADDLNKLKDSISDFLGLIRANNPTAVIVWAYGMLGYELTLPIAEAISDYKLNSRDSRVHFVQLPDTTDEMMGARCHPGVRSHARAAKELAEFLGKLLRDEDVR